MVHRYKYGICLVNEYKLYEEYGGGQIMCFVQFYRENLQISLIKDNTSM